MARYRIMLWGAQYFPYTKTPLWMVTHVIYVHVYYDNKAIYSSRSAPGGLAAESLCLIQN